MREGDVLGHEFMGDVVGDLNSCSIQVKRNLDGARYPLGSSGKRKQPLAQFADITATLDADFADWTNYNRVLNNTQAALIVTLTGAVISHAYTFSLTLTMNVVTDGTAPTLSGPGRISQPLKMTALDSGSGAGSALTAVYRSTDSAS